MLPDIPGFGVTVSDFGAKGDGAADDAPAIQRALDAASPLVVVPFGVYRLGRTLRIAGGTTLRVHPRARLVMADRAGVDSDSFLLTNRNHSGGDADITIEGGIWDGNNAANPRGPDRPGAYTGVALNFIGVRGLVLRNMVLRDPESYYIRLGETSRFMVETIRLEAPHLRPNQDGVHLGGGCRDGIIRNIEAHGPSVPNDDVVALNADDAPFRAQNLGMKCGPIRNIRVENICAEDCHTFVRLATVWSAIENIEIRNVVGGCQNYVLNLDALRYCRVPAFRADEPGYSQGVGLVRNFYADGLTVHGTGHGQAPLLCLESRLAEFEVRNLRRDTARDARPERPTLRVRNIRTDAITLEGIAEQDAAELVEQSENCRVDLRTLPPLQAGLRRYRADIGVEPSGSVVSHAQHIDRLRVGSSEIRDLPPCPWGGADVE